MFCKVAVLLFQKRGEGAESFPISKRIQSLVLHCKPEFQILNIAVGLSGKHLLQRIALRMHRFEKERFPCSIYDETRRCVSINLLYDHQNIYIQVQCWCCPFLTPPKFFIHSLLYKRRFCA